MIDVVIVNWNSGEQLVNCIESLFKSEEVDLNIIVVDNASVDNSLDLISHYSKISIVTLESNIGFAAGCNVGAKYGRADYILFLNPDAGVYPDTLISVKTVMDKIENNDIGICGVQLLDTEGKVSRSCARFPNIIQISAHIFGLDRVFRKLNHFMVEWDHEDTREVDQVIGAFFFVRRSLYDSLKGFDERFFVYYEEVDFSLRARKNNAKTLFYSKAKAFHEGCGSSNKVKAKRLFYSLRSRLLYFKKNESFLTWLFIGFLTLFIEPFSRLVFSSIKLSREAMFEVIEGYRMLYSWILKRK